MGEGYKMKIRLEELRSPCCNVKLEQLNFNEHTVNCSYCKKVVRLEEVDVSKVNVMASIFKNASTFNQDLDKWG